MNPQAISQPFTNDMETSYDSDCDVQSINSEFSLLSAQDAAPDPEEIHSLEPRVEQQTLDDFNPAGEQPSEEQATKQQATEQQATEQQGLGDLLVECLEEVPSWGDQKDAEAKHRFKDNVLHRLNAMLDALNHPFDFEDADEFAKMLDDFCAELQKLWLETGMSKAGEKELKLSRLRLDLEQKTNRDLSRMIQHLRYELNMHRKERTDFCKQIGLLRTDLTHAKDRNGKLLQIEAHLRAKLSDFDQFCARLASESQIVKGRSHYLEQNLHRSMLEKQDILCKAEASERALTQRCEEVIRKEQVLTKEQGALREDLVAKQSELEKMKAALEEERARRAAQDERHVEEKEKLTQQQRLSRQQERQPTDAGLAEHARKMEGRVQVIEALMNRRSEEHEAGRILYEEHIADLEGQVDQLEKQISWMNQKIDESEGKLRVANKWYAEEVTETRHSEQAYGQQIEALRERLENTQHLLNDANLARRDSDNVLTTSKEELEKMRDLLEASQNEAVKLRGQLDEHKRLLSAHTQKWRSRTDQIDTMQTQLANEKTATRRLMIELGQLTRDYKCLQTSSATAEEQVKSLTAEKNVLACVNCDALRQEIDAGMELWDDFKVGAQKKKAAHEREIKSLRTEVAARHARIDGLAAEMVILKVEKKEAVAKGNGRCAALQREIDLKMEAWERCDVQVREERDAAWTEIMGLKTDIAAKSACIDALTTEIATWRVKEKEAVEMGNAQLSALRQEMDAKMEMWEKSDVQMQGERDAAWKEVVDLQTKLATTESACRDGLVAAVGKSNGNGPALPEDMVAAMNALGRHGKQMQGERDAAWKVVKELQTTMATTDGPVVTEGPSNDHASTVPDDTVTTMRALGRHGKQMQEERDVAWRGLRDLVSELTARNARIEELAAEVAALKGKGKEVVERGPARGDSALPGRSIAEMGGWEKYDAMMRKRQEAAWSRAWDAAGTDRVDGRAFPTVLVPASETMDGEDDSLYEW